MEIVVDSPGVRFGRRELTLDPRRPLAPALRVQRQKNYRRCQDSQAAPRNEGRSPLDSRLKIKGLAVSVGRRLAPWDQTHCRPAPSVLQKEDASSLCPQNGWSESIGGDPSGAQLQDCRAAPRCQEGVAWGSPRGDGRRATRMLQAMRQLFMVGPAHCSSIDQICVREPLGLNPRFSGVCSCWHEPISSHVNITLPGLTGFEKTFENPQRSRCPNHFKSRPPTSPHPPADASPVRRRTSSHPL